MSQSGFYDTLEEEFFDEELSNIERRKALESAERVAADIEHDLNISGPLALYVQSRKREASESLRVLVNLDPSDAVAVAMAQQSVKEYLRAIDWIYKSVEAARDAARAKGEDVEDYGEEAFDD